MIEKDVLDDHHASLGGVEDVGDARAPGGVVDRHLDCPELEDPEPRVQEVRPVTHHDRDPVTLGDSQAPQARGDVAGALGDLRIGHGVIVEDGKHPVAELCCFLIDKRR